MRTMLLWLLPGLLPGLLSGCVSIRYSPIYADSPAPPSGPHSVCKGPLDEDTFTLQIGASCMFPIRADEKLTRTPIALEPGHTYRVSVPPNQMWYDDDRPSTPPHGDRGSVLMNLFSKWKRQRNSLWFALIAANVGRAPKSTDEYEARDVSEDPVLSFCVPGRLAFYPNDAIAPSGREYYANNRGQIWVRIERAVPEEKSTSTCPQ